MLGNDFNNIFSFSILYNVIYIYFSDNMYKLLLFFSSINMKINKI